MGISIHPPRAGRDQVGAFANRENAEFQSTRPVRGGTFGPKAPAKKPKKFQSTRPVRGGTPNMDVVLKPSKFQSTRPVRGGTCMIVKWVSD